MLFLYYDQPPISQCQENEPDKSVDNSEKSRILHSGSMNTYGTQENEAINVTPGGNTGYSINASSEDEEVAIRKPHKKGFLAG